MVARQTGENFEHKQECIPVGCVPAAGRPYGRVCFPGGVVSAPGGLSAPRGDLLQGRVSAPRGVSALGGVCSLRVSAPGGGGSAPRGVCARGVSAPWGCGIPACTEAEPPPVNRMTDRSKNITLATTSLRPVISLLSSIYYCPPTKLLGVNTFSRMCLPFHGWGESSGGFKGGVIFIKFRQFSVIGIQLKFLLVFKTFNERI